MTVIHNSNDASFDYDVLQASTPVLVDFWAPWCGPCKALTPVLNELAEKHPESIKVVAINIDKDSEQAAKLAVRGIPALFVYDKGKLIKQLPSGTNSLQKLESELNLS